MQHDLPYLVVMRYASLLMWKNSLSGMETGAQI
jgi:hypothetical protein